MQNFSFQPWLKVKNNPLALLVALWALAASGGLARAQTVEELGVSRHSSFDPATLHRDPFTPIGWQKPMAAAPVVNGVKQEPVFRAEAFMVSSISVDRIPLAVINGRPYGEGDSIAWTEAGRTMKAQVFAIRDGVVTLRMGDVTVKCPIRARPQPVAPGKEGVSH